ncbi:Predicted arabinose efflux permease, MFS family [Nocardioides sp. YR527]|uniref:MFS transporter n=1 Tax=Nocardioides sp. YR527 TaxID=1881028 RepID=UPI000880C8B8|nr:MFS transporter [Nocardioides sp. YR527]SDL20772.1 Predicted arabinose efflux permease, MFS family [Nocardioides sp. YR527]
MSPTFRSLRSHNYRLYLAGSVVSNVGTWMQRIAQDWLVLSLGGGGAALGITTGLQFLPILLLSPYAGVIADRFPKRRLLQVAQGWMALMSLLLGVLAVSGHAEVWMVYVIAFLFGTGAAFDGPGRQSFVSEMVHPDDLTNAVGLNSASFNLARLIGPALAGLLIGSLGSGPEATGWVILVNAVSYLAVIGQLQRMNTAELSSPDPVARRSGMLREGIGYIRTQPKMLMVLVIIFFVGTFGANFPITSALMATEEFGKGASEYGLLGTVLAIGSLSGALLGARRTRIPLKLIVLAATGFGLTVIVSGMMPTYALFALVSPVLGFFTITTLNACNATMQTEAAPEFRGRVMAIYMTVLMGGTPLGAPLIGFIGEHFGARTTLYASGAMVLLGTLAGVLLLAALRGGIRAVLTPSQAAG